MEWSIVWEKGTVDQNLIQSRWAVCIRWTHRTISITRRQLRQEGKEAMWHPNSFSEILPWWPLPNFPRYLYSLTSIFIPILSIFLLPAIYAFVTLAPGLLSQVTVSRWWSDLRFENHCSKKGLSFCKRTCPINSKATIPYRYLEARCIGGSWAPRLCQGTNFYQANWI